MKKAEDYLLDIRQKLVELNLGKKVVSMKDAKKMPYYNIYVDVISQVQKDIIKEYEEKIRWIPIEEKEPESFKNDEDGIYYSKYLELKVNGYEYPLIGYYVNANDDQFFDIISEKDDIKQKDITHFRECFL